MSALDAALPPLALTLIRQFGKTLTYRVIGAAAYNPATGRAGTAPTDTGIKGLVEDYPAGGTLGGETTEGGVRRGDKKVTLPALGLPAVPTTAHKLVIDGILYAALKVDAIYSGEAIALYVLQARR